MNVPSLPSLWRELRERRVPQILLLYAGAGWALAEGVGFFVEHYDWSRRVLDVTVFLLVVGLPAAAVVGWYHGARGPQRPTRREATLLGALLLVAAAGTLWIATAEQPSAAALAASGGPPSVEEGAIAVMPLRNALRPDSLAWLGRGSASLLETNLAQLPDARVVSGQRLFDLLRMEGVEDSLSIPEEMATAVARRSGAQFMVTGSILGRPEALSMNVSLVELESGRIVAATSARGSAADVFALVDRISRDLSTQVTSSRAEPTELTPVAELTTGDLTALRAFEAGLQARRRFHLREAVQHFERAVELDPEFALAHLNLAFLYGQLSDFPAMIASLEEAADHLSEAASRADRLYVEAMLAVFRGDHETAETKLRQAVAEAPDDKFLRVQLQDILWTLGRREEATAVLEEVVRLDPLYATGFNRLAYRRALAGDFAAADSLVRRYMELEPEEANPWDSWGEILELQGDHERARAAYREALRRRPDFIAREHLVRSYLREDRPADARRELRELDVDSLPHVPAQTTRLIAATWLYEGEMERALEALREAARIAGDAGLAGDRMAAGETMVLVHALLGDTAAVREATETEDPSPFARVMRNLMELVMAGETGQTARLDSLQREVMRGLEEARLIEVAGPVFPQYVRGTVAFYRGNHEEAVEGLTAPGAEDQLANPPYLRVRALLEAGRARDALKAVGPEAPWLGLPVLIFALNHHPKLYFRGRAYEQLADTAAAREAYREFLDGWGEVAERMPLFSDADERLEALGGE